MTGLSVAEREVPELLRHVGLEVIPDCDDRGEPYADAWRVPCPTCGVPTATLTVEEGGRLFVYCVRCDASKERRGRHSWSAVDLLKAYAPEGMPALAREPKAPPEVLDWSRLVLATPPEVPWLVEGFLAERSLGMLVGDFGFGKSWLAYDLALSLASGAPVWETFAVRRPVRALVLDEENGPEEVPRRFSKLARGRGMEEPVPVFACCGAGYKLDDAAGLRALCELAKGQGAELVILDSLRRFHDGDENSSRDMARVTAGLRALTAEAGVSVVSLYHPRKLGMVSNQAREMIRGSKEVPAGLDAAAFVRKTAEGLLVVECAKARRSAEWGSFALRMDEGEEGGITFALMGEAEEAEDRITQAQAVMVSAAMDAGGRLDRPALLEACAREGIAKRTAEEGLRRAQREGQLRKAGKQGRRTVYAMVSEALL